MSDDLSVGAVVEHARGVLAERFGVGISTADSILNDVTPLPRRLYAINDETEGAA